MASLAAKARGYSRTIRQGAIFQAADSTRFIKVSKQKSFHPLFWAFPLYFQGIFRVFLGYFGRGVQSYCCALCCTLACLFKGVGRMQGGGIS